MQSLNLGEQLDCHNSSKAEKRPKGCSLQQRERQNEFKYQKEIAKLSQEETCRLNSFKNHLGMMKKRLKLINQMHSQGQEAKGALNKVDLNQLEQRAAQEYFQENNGDTQKENHCPLFSNKRITEHNHNVKPQAEPLNFQILLPNSKSSQVSYTNEVTSVTDAGLISFRGPDTDQKTEVVGMGQDYEHQPSFNFRKQDNISQKTQPAIQNQPTQPAKPKKVKKHIEIVLADLEPDSKEQNANRHINLKVVKAPMGIPKPSMINQSRSQNLFDNSDGKPRQLIPYPADINCRYNLFSPINVSGLEKDDSSLDMTIQIKEPAERVKTERSSPISDDLKCIGLKERNRHKSMADFGKDKTEIDKAKATIKETTPGEELKKQFKTPEQLAEIRKEQRKYSGARQPRNAVKRTVSSLSRDPSPIFVRNQSRRNLYQSVESKIDNGRRAKPSSSICKKLFLRKKNQNTLEDDSKQLNSSINFAKEKLKMLGSINRTPADTQSRSRSRKQAKELTKRNYQKLPEVQERNKSQERRKDLLFRKQKAKEYDAVVNYN